MKTNSARWLAIAALALAGVVVGLDTTVLNVALATLATALHASTADLQWFIGAYSLVWSAAMLPAGALGDRFGRKRFLVVALVLFGAASALCAASTTPAELIAARALLGLGAAFIVPLSMAVVPVLFSADERPKAVALLVVATLVCFPVGPLLGGWLLDHASWPWVFLLNVPVVAVAVVAVIVLLPESKSTTPIAVDPLGVATSSAGLVAITWAVIQSGENGWSAPSTWLPLAAGIALLSLFLLSQGRARTPLVDLALFRAPGFAAGTALATLTSFAMFGVLFAVPQFFQIVRASSAFDTGLQLLPLVVGLIAAAGLGRALSKFVGPAFIVALGFACLATALFVGAHTSIDDDTRTIVAWIGLAGAGLGFALPIATDAALGALSIDQSGVGSALIAAMRTVGGTVGVALLGAVLNDRYRAHVDVARLPESLAAVVHKSAPAGVAVATKMHDAALLSSARDAFVDGMNAMLLVGVCVAVFGALLALAFLPRTRQQSRDARPSPL